MRSKAEELMRSSVDALEAFGGEVPVGICRERPVGWVVFRCGRPRDARCGEVCPVGFLWYGLGPVQPLCSMDYH